MTLDVPSFSTMARLASLLSFIFGFVSLAAAQYWLSSWSTMPQLTETSNLPAAPFNTNGDLFQDTTIRQSFKISVPGSKFRLRFSNAFSDVSLDITAVTVALPATNGTVGTASINTQTLRPVTFSGGKSFSVPNGAQVVSDAIDWAIPENSVLTVSLYLANGQRSSTNSITSHPGSRTTTFYGNGNQTSAATISGTTSNSEHWFFISGLEVYTSDQSSYAVAIVGDSITDGRGSTSNANDRYVSFILDDATLY
jgi:hypothetical protein